MRSLGLDWGDKRTGVAISDPLGVLAFPLTVITAEDEDATISDIIKLTEQHEIGRIVVGLPRCLNGDIGEQANKVNALLEKLSLRAGRSNLDELDVQLWDERLSTKAAERLIMEASSKGNKLRSRTRKGAKASRSAAKVSVDAMAAAFILQGFLDSLKEMSL